MHTHTHTHTHTHIYIYIYIYVYIHTILSSLTSSPSLPSTDAARKELQDLSVSYERLKSESSREVAKWKAKFVSAYEVEYIRS